MTDAPDENEAETRRLVVAITDFLRDQLIIRTDLVPEDKDCLEIAIQCLEMAYGLEGNGYIQYRFSRPLMDIFNQVTNPVSVRDKLRADAHKDEGNNYMRRRMFENAESEYTSAIELDKWNSIYYCNRASARIEQSNFFEAIADCRQALMLNSDYAKAHARMGQAYALIHRPREAARCFRQALQLEPENERYRHNLRVAENQINRPDVGQAIASLIGSLFGLGSQTGEERSSRMLPTSFMIITESHPPTTQTSSRPAEVSEITGNSQTSQSTPVSKNTANESSLTTNSIIQPITFPAPYGVLDEGEEEQPIPEFELPPGENQEEDFAINIPLFSFDINPATQSSRTENSLQNRENGQEKTVEKTKNNVSEKETLSQDNSEVQENVTKDTYFPHIHIPEAFEMKNQPEKTKTGESTVEVSEEVPDTEKKKLEKDQEDSYNAKGSSNNGGTEEQSGTNNNSGEGNNGLSSTEKSQDYANSSDSGYNFTNDDDYGNKKYVYDFTSEKDKKTDEKKGENIEVTKNESTDAGETSKKHISLEEEVD